MKTCLVGAELYPCRQTDKQRDYEANRYFSQFCKHASNCWHFTFLRMGKRQSSAVSGPEGSRELRFPDFMTTAQDGGKVVRTGRLYPQEMLLVLTSFGG